MERYYLPTPLYGCVTPFVGHPPSPKTIALLRGVVCMNDKVWEQTV
jgi:hypothetical protein